MPRAIDAIDAGTAERAYATEEVRRWPEALVLSGLSFVATYSGALWSLCKLPWSAGTAWQHTKYAYSLFRAYAPGGISTPPPLMLEHLWQPGLALVAAGCVAAWIGYETAKPRSRITHIDGPQLLRGKAAVRSASQQSEKLAEKEGGWMRLQPALNLPKSHWNKATLICGGVGSGKTQILLYILDQLERRKAKAIIYDVKADFTSYYPKSYLISPWDKRSVYWHVAKDLNTATAVSAFAASLIPDNPKGEPFWTQAPRTVLIGVIKLLRNQFYDTWGWRTLSRTLNLPREQLYESLRGIAPDAAMLIGPKDSNTVQSILSILSAAARIVHELAEAWEEPAFDPNRTGIAFSEWAKDDYQGPRQIILQAGPDRTMTSAYIAAIVNALVPAIVSPILPDDESRCLAFVLDELTSIGKIDIAPLIDKGRSKGVVAILAYQDIAQVREVYGEEMAKALTSMVGTNLVLKMGMGPTRDAIAEHFGKRRVGITTHSRAPGTKGVSVQQHEEARAVIDSPSLTTELGLQRGKQWPEGFAIRAIASIGGDPLMLDWPGVKKQRKRKGFVRADWLSGFHRPASGSITPEEAQRLAENAEKMLEGRDAELDAVGFAPIEFASLPTAEENEEDEVSGG